MTHLIAVLLRTVSIAVSVVLYFTLASWGEQGDANIGAGLLAFFGLVVLGFTWALFDAARDGFATTAIRWVVVGSLVGTGWVLIMSVIEADESMSAADLIRVDAWLAVWIGCLIAVPAVVGAAIGVASTRGQEV